MRPRLNFVKNEKLRRTLKASMASRLSHAKSKSDARQALVTPSPDEAGSRPGLEVRVIRHARRLLDVDNAIGGCKPLIDQLRYQGLIPGDDPGSIDLSFRQVRVKSKAEEGTLIEITSIVRT